MTDERVVGAERVLAVMIALAQYPNGAGLDELAGRLNSSKSTVHRALRTLRKPGLVNQPARGVYTLGDEFLRLAYQFQSERPDGAMIEPALRHLSSHYRETAHYGVLSGRDVVYRAKADPAEGSVRLSSVVGGRNPAHTTALGKLLLALSVDSEAELRRTVGEVPLEKRTERTITDVRILWEQLRVVKARGFATCDQENELGVNSVAVGVRFPDSDKVTAAVAVTALEFRTPLRRLVEDAPYIQQCVDDAIGRGRRD